MYNDSRFEAMYRNNGEPAHRIDRSRFWEMLEVMWPRRWQNEPVFEFFSVDEPYCGSACGKTLYLFCARINIEGEDHYFEMISPEDATVSEIVLKVQKVLAEEGRALAAGAL